MVYGLMIFFFFFYKIFIFISDNQEHYIINIILRNHKKSFSTKSKLSWVIELCYYMSEGLYSLPRKLNTRVKRSNLTSEVNPSDMSIAINISLKDLIFICKILPPSDSRFKHFVK